jgi:hypothetical protein
MMHFELEQWQVTGIKMELHSMPVIRRGQILTHCLTVVLMMESRLQIALTNVYGPTNPTQKLDFMREIIWIRDQISLP